MAAPRPGRVLITRLLPVLVTITVVAAAIRWYLSAHELLDEVAGIVMMASLSIALFTVLAVFSARRLDRLAGAEREAARASLYRTLARSVPGGGFYLFDRDLRYVLVEGPNLAPAGLHPEQLEGRTIWEALDPEVADEVEPLYRAALEGEMHMVEMEFRGEHYLTTFAPARDESGAIAGGLVHSQSITERKRLETQLRQAQKLEAVGQLAGGVAHDFNNLLTVILGNTAFARKGLEQSDPLDKQLEQIEDAARSAARLTRQLLAFSRRQVLAPDVLDANLVVERVVPMLSRLVEERIEIRTRLATRLPQILFDEGQLEQLLINLVVNARDAITDAGTITIETGEAYLDSNYVALHDDAQAGPHVVISVSDDGHGMDEGTQQRIFDPFFTTKPVGRGTGLGLATVHGIVKQSGGNIWVYSEPGEGTTFKIYIPVSPESATAAVPPITAEPTQPGKRLSVLVVEDAAPVRRLISMILKSGGHVVHETVSVAEARALLPTIDADLILSDVVMPGGNGRELQGVYDSTGKTPPIIFMSGYTEEHISQRDLAASGHTFIQKPFSPDQLLRLIQTVAPRA